ncbi:MAG: HAMP domain-containing protein [Sedimentisphaerales bacterium]|nr:HAMP domain-containing protein [Sedimentisphaerales bacterium]
MRNLTIKNKLIAITMLTCFASLLLAGTGYILWEWTNLRRIMARNLLTQAEMIAENCKAALAFEDPKDSLAVLQALHVEPSIVLGCVYNNKNEIFVSYSNQDTDRAVTLPVFTEEGYEFSNGYLTVYKHVVLEGEVIGAVCLRSDLEPLYVKLCHGACIIICVLLIAFFVAYLVSSRLQRIISKPILDLADIAKNISEKEDYSVRAVSHTNDEIGLLINTFNGMLEQIQRRDSALVKAKDDLERRVDLRTADLTAANERLVMEIAERKKSEEKQTELLETIAKTNEELQDFAYIISHDLKAPLRGISTLTEWIMSDYANKFDDDGREQMNLLSARVHRMHDLIEGVLQYSRVGRVNEEHVQVNLNELVPEVIDMISPPDNIEITIENELPLVECGQTRIMQVFQNLLSNAIKYMDKPEGRIKVGCKEENSLWIFSVADNGPGIEEKYFVKIFQIFQTLSARDEFESTGVGLTVTKKIVELYGGKIWVESTPGQGSTFFFSLPKNMSFVCDNKSETVMNSK